MKYLLSKKLVIGLGALGITTFIYCLKRNSKPRRYLAISVGGTNSKICILQKNEYLNFLTLVGPVHEIETKTPVEFVTYVKIHFSEADFDEIVIASFGPLNLKRGMDYGKLITVASKQKATWANFSLGQELSSIFKKPYSVETDVNAAAIAEFNLGNHGKIKSLAYITIGTGVGVGLVINGQTVHGFLHPEGGHTMFIHKS